MPSISYIHCKPIANDDKHFCKNIYYALRVSLQMYYIKNILYVVFFLVNLEYTYCARYFKICLCINSKNKLYLRWLEWTKLENTPVFVCAWHFPFTIYTQRLS